MCPKKEITVIAKVSVRNSMPGQKKKKISLALAFSIPVFALKHAEIVWLSYD